MRVRQPKDYSLDIYADLFKWTPPPWLSQAACRNIKYRPSWWKRKGKTSLDMDLSERARAICVYECPVRYRCLSRFITEPFGIFGGLNGVERKELRESIFPANWGKPDVLRAKLEKNLSIESEGSSVEIRVSNL